MHAGNLNRKVSIMLADQVSDGQGGFEDTLTLVKSVWANFQPISGRDLWRAKQIQAEVTHKLTIRYISDLFPSHIIQYNGKNYDIQYIMDVDFRQKFLEVYLLERLND